MSSCKHCSPATPILLAGIFLLAATHTTMAAPAPVPRVEPRIIGGEPAPVDAWPFAAQVMVEDGDSSGFCGGTVLSPNWVLTAGHCVVDRTDQLLPADAFQVITGTHLLMSADGTWSEVSEVRLHPDFFIDRFNAPNNDLALLKLSTPVDEASVPVAAGSPTAGEPATVIGWGLTDPDTTTDLSEVLQEVEIPVVSNAACNAEYGGIITDVMLCAGVLDGSADACIGDSGGPLLVEGSNGHVQVGIVSFGQDCALSYGVYTRLSEFDDWISGITGVDPEGPEDGNDGDDGDNDGGGGGGAFGPWWLLASVGLLWLAPMRGRTRRGG
jgi:secreted trypsin-like serine protease